MDSYSYDSDECYFFHDDDSSGDPWEPDDNERFYRELRRVRNNDPNVRQFSWRADGYNILLYMTEEEWRDIGRDLSNNTYLEELDLSGGVLDSEEISCVFRGLTRSSSVVMLELSENDISAVGLRRLQPFLKNSANLRRLIVSYNDFETKGFNFLMRVLRDSPVESLFCSHCGISSIEFENVPNNLRLLELSDNNIKSEGFNLLLRSLRDSSIEELLCSDCGIESIDIDTDSFPRSLKELDLTYNRIDSNGCHEIAKFLKEGDTRLEKLFLGCNLIDDEGVEILVDALKTNATLEFLELDGNDGISRNGRILMLQLVNDISSIKATLQSNHTLQTIRLRAMLDEIHRYINMATTCNRQDAVRASREKVIQTQLDSQRRAKLAAMQGVQSQSVYGEIDPLHLPEVLSLVSRRHGQDELYLALKASIAEVITDNCG